MFSKTNQGRRKFPKFKAFKAILSIALALAMVIASLPLGAIRVKADDPEVVAQGDCSAEGSNVIYEITKNGTYTDGETEKTAYRLTIKGNGKIKTYSRMSNIPWRSDAYKESITDIVIESGVTNILPDCFYNCIRVKSVSIPNTVTEIGDSAFYRCINLENISIPFSVSNMGEEIFWSCTKLKTVTLEEGCSAEIHKNVFSQCYSLETVTIPSTITQIDESAFYMCENLSAVNVASENPAYLSDDGVLLTKDKTRLIVCPATKTSYTIPDSVASIDSGAFYGSKMQTVVIPEGVTEIKEETFKSSNIVNITLPSTLSKVGESAFVYSKLKYVTFRGTENEWKKITIDYSNGNNDRLKIAIFTYAPSYNINVVGGTANPKKGGKGDVITITADVPVTGKVFSKWTSVDNVTFTDESKSTTSFTMPDKEVTVTANFVDGYAVTMNGGTADLSLAPAGATVTISADTSDGKMFTGWSSEDGITFADSSASSTTFTMPNKAVEIKANFIDVYTVTMIGGTADKSKVPAGATVAIAADTSDSGKVFLGWRGGKDVNFDDATASSTTFTMPARNVTIEAYFVSDLQGYCGAEGNETNVEWNLHGDTLTISGTGAMADYGKYSKTPWYKNGTKRIKKIVISEGVTKICDYAFGCLVYAETVTIPASVTVIGALSFIGCYSLTSIIIDDDNSVYSSEAGVLFDKNKSKLIWYPAGKVDETYTIPESVTEICDCAFERCLLKNITIPGNVKKIGISAFFDVACSSFIIEDGVEEIGFGAILNNIPIDISIPKSVKSIGKIESTGNPIVESFIDDVGEMAIAGVNNVYLCGDETELYDYTFRYVMGNVYAPAKAACDELELNAKKEGFSIKYICDAPNLEGKSIEYTGSKLTVYEPAANCGYSISGNGGTDVGDYTATATINAKRVLGQDKAGNDITATYVWGDLSKPETWADATDTADKTFEWSIKAPVVLSSIAVTTAPKTTYTEGESFDATGMVITATYSDGTTCFASRYTCAPTEKLAVTDKAVTISYTENGVTVTTTLDITVQAKSEGPVEYVTVQIIPGKNMDGAHVSASGALVQKVALGTKIDEIGFQFNEDFDGYIPENYTVEQVNGITVKCVRGENGIGIIEISGTPTIDLIIQLPDAGSKKADEEAKKNNTGSENGGSGYTDGGSGSNSSYNGGSSNYSGGSGNTSGGSGNTGSSNAGSGSASGSGNKNGNETNTSGSGATTNPDTKVKENSDGTKTETVVKTNDDGSTVKTQTTKDAEGKVLQTVTQKTETTTDGSTVTTKSTENNDGTYTTSTKTVNTDGSTVTKTESKDAEGIVTSKEVTKTKDSTVTVEETKTEAGDVYTKETTKTAESTVISENTETADGTVSTKVTTKTAGSTTVEEKISSADNSTIVRKSVTDKKGTSTVNEMKTDKKGNVTTTEETVKKNGTGSSKSVTVDKDNNEISATSTETKKDKKGTLIVTSETVNKNAEGSEVKSVESSIKYFKSGEVKTETTEISADGSYVTTKNTINVDENGNLAVVSEVTEIDAEGKETKSTTTVTVEVDESGKPVLSEITADGKTAVIPDVIVSDGQIIPVTAIGDGAMKGNKKVTGVKLGKNITEIGAKAFYKDKKLKNIGLTGSIQTIEKKAFKGTAKDAVFTISATSKKEFKRVKKLVIKAGASKNATFVYEKESK